VEILVGIVAEQGRIKEITFPQVVLVQLAPYHNQGCLGGVGNRVVIRCEGGRQSGGGDALPEVVVELIAVAVKSVADG